MNGSSSDRGLLLAAVAMTLGTLAVAGLAAAGALRAPHSTPTATERPSGPSALSVAPPEEARSRRAATPTPTSTSTSTATPTSDGFADERPPPGPPPPTPTIATPEAPPVVRRAPRERIQVPRTVSAWGT